MSGIPDGSTGAPVRLAELEPQFIRYRTLRAGGDPVFYRCDVATLDEAQGLWFLCPVCFQRNGGAVGTHLVETTFRDRGASDDEGSHGRDGTPSRWGVSGSSFEDLTLTPSIDLGSGGCGWHGFITEGEAK